MLGCEVSIKTYHTPCQAVYQTGLDGFDPVVYPVRTHHEVVRYLIAANLLIKDRASLVKTPPYLTPKVTTLGLDSPVGRKRRESRSRSILHKTAAPSILCAPAALNSFLVYNEY